MSKPVRVRFAPSPTGFLHLGTLRSALFNFLLARHHNGSFILRIEDTDRERLVPGAVEQIQESLTWLGLAWDEGVGKGGEQGPYVQSERLDLYRTHAETLIDKGFAYKDYSSAERLAELRQEAQRNKQPFRFTKELAQTEPANSDDPFVIRFHIQPGADVIWNDAVWGEQSWKREVLDDFVAIKSDGYPTYNFAVVIDDHLMNISHVLRGSEFLSTAPKTLLVYQAFDWEPPMFVHLPPVLGPDKAKLSKRHGAKSASEYRDAGYLPEAVFNYLASLGFNDGTTQELYTQQELIKAFTPERIQSSPAVFDAERLDWMNGSYIRQLSLDDLYTHSEAFWPTAAKKYPNDYQKAVLSLVHERLKYLAEIEELTEFFFSDPEVDPKLLTKFDDNERAALLKASIESLEGSSFTESDLEERLRDTAAKKAVKVGHYFSLLRACLTGRTAAPGLFETMHVLGKEVSLKRLSKILERSKA